MSAPARSSRRERVEVVEEVVEPAAPGRGEAAQRVAAPVLAARHALQQLAAQRAAGPPRRDREVGAGERVARGADRESQVRERGAGAGAVEHLDPDRRVGGDAGLGAEQLHTEQHRAHAGEHRDVARAGAAVEPLPHLRERGTGQLLGCVTRGGERDRTRRLRGADRLRDADAVVAEQVRGGADDIGRAPVVDLELQVGGAGEELVVVDEERGVRARVAVDHLVVVADTEHVVGGRRDQAQHQELRGREVLELVDEQVPALGLELAPDRDVRQQHLERAVDLLVVIHHAVGRHAVAELLEHHREAVDVVAPRLDLVRRNEPEAHLRERFEVRRVHVGVRARTDREQRFDAPAHVPLGEHVLDVARTAHDVEAERVQRPDLAQRAGTHIGEPLFHLGLGPHVVGHRAHRRRTPTALGDEQPEPLGEHARLAGTGRRDDPRRPAGMGDRRELIGREVGDDRRRRRRRA